MKYRSRTDITGQILEVAQGGTSKTKIMYKAFLSYAQLKEYLSFLESNGLIDYDSTRQMYHTSAKGIKFLGLYSQMDELVLANPTK